MKKRDNLLTLSVPVLILIFLSVLEGNARPAFAQVTPDKEAMKKSEEKVETPPAPGGQRGLTPVGSNIFIAEKNIFNPERKDFPVQAGAKPVARPQIILYGVTIAGGYQAASIVNPGRSLHKGERETITLRAGEQIGGYKLAQVSPDRILLEGAGDSFEVLLYDSTKMKKRVDAKTENKPTTVTNPFALAGEGPKPALPPVAAMEPPKDRAAIQTPADRSRMPTAQGRMGPQAGPGMPTSAEPSMPPASMPTASMPTPTAAPMTSMPTPTGVTPPTNTIPTPSTPVTRGRFYRGGTTAPTAPAPTN